MLLATASPPWHPCRLIQLANAFWSSDGAQQTCQCTFLASIHIRTPTGALQSFST